MTETASFLRRSADATGVRVAENAVRQSFAERRDILSWGRVDRRPQRWACPHFHDGWFELLRDPEWPHKLAIGLRRSYGNSCLNSAGALIEMIQLDRLIAFDPLKGRLRGEAEVSLSEALKMVVPRGWFCHGQGTRFVTLGGAVANDVHGKNHVSAGTFGRHVRRLSLRRTDGSRIELGADDPTGLFAATLGGLGLTGVIEWVELSLERIPSSFIDAEDIAFGSLDEFFAIAAESDLKYEHTVAWIDCTGAAGPRAEAYFRAAIWRAAAATRSIPPQDACASPWNSLNMPSTPGR